MRIFITILVIFLSVSVSFGQIGLKMQAGSIGRPNRHFANANLTANNNRLHTWSGFNFEMTGVGRTVWTSDLYELYNNAYYAQVSGNAGIWAQNATMSAGTNELAPTYIVSVQPDNAQIGSFNFDNQILLRDRGVRVYGDSLHLKLSSISQPQPIIWESAGGYTKLRGAPTNTAGWTMTLPTGPGSAGQSLTTDGAGNTSWGGGGELNWSHTSSFADGNYTASGGGVYGFTIEDYGTLEFNATSSINSHVPVRNMYTDNYVLRGHNLASPIFELQRYNGIQYYSSSFTPHNTQNTNINYTLPATLPGSNQALVATSVSGSAVQLGWVTQGNVNNGGNSFGAAMSVGTNDAQDLNIERNNTTAITLSSSGTTIKGTFITEKQVVNQYHTNTSTGTVTLSATNSYTNYAPTSNQAAVNIVLPTITLYGEVRAVIFSKSVTALTVSSPNTIHGTPATTAAIGDYIEYLSCQIGWIRVR
jgi:hypothetical protein